MKVRTIRNYLAENRYKWEGSSEDGAFDENDEDFDSFSHSWIDRIKDPNSWKFAEPTYTGQATFIALNYCALPSFVQHPAQDCSAELHVSPESSSTTVKGYLFYESPGDIQHGAKKTC